MQACFLILGPPNFFLSRQYSHLPQSSVLRQAAHFVHLTPRFLFESPSLLSGVKGVRGLWVRRAFDDDASQEASCNSSLSPSSMSGVLRLLSGLIMGVDMSSVFSSEDDTNSYGSRLIRLSESPSSLSNRLDQAFA